MYTTYTYDDVYVSVDEVIRAVNDDIERIYTADDHARYLDECYDKVEILGIEYGCGEALKEVDPIAFDISRSDRIVDLVDSIRDEVNEGCCSQIYVDITDKVIEIEYE